MLKLNEIYNEDCIGKSGMCLIPSKSIDMILSDLPYGVTARCAWDVVIPFVPLWRQYKRIIKDNGAICLTATEPFSSMLVMSNQKMFRYDWIWKKPHTGFFNANRMPLRNHEQILVFYKALPTYNPQKTPGEPYKTGKRGPGDDGIYNVRPKDLLIVTDNKDGMRYPKSVQEFAWDRERLHSTQKPVALFEFLIKTYTNEGELVLDNCMGSGTTAVACINTFRNFLGFELDKEIFKIAQERIQKCTKGEYRRRLGDKKLRLF